MGFNSALKGLNIQKLFILHTVRSCDSYGSQSKERLFP